MPTAPSKAKDFLADNLPCELAAPRTLTPLSLLFRPAFLDRAATGKHVRMLREIVEHAGLDPATAPPQSLAAVLDKLYRILVDNYRCEYVFKNAIANNIFLGLHRPEKSIMLNEFRSGQCRADIVILNGTSSVYEIKTDLDSLSKLFAQVEEYKKIFDKIYVVTSPSMRDRVLASTSDDIGVLCLTDKLAIKISRRARSNKDNTSPAHIFDCLRRAEFVEIIKKITGGVPDVSNARIYTECKKIFCELAPADAHAMMVSALKKRLEPAVWNLAHSMPQSLRHLCLSVSGPQKHIESIANALNSPCAI